MNDKILLVDDDLNVLQSYQRSLRKEFPRLNVAAGGAQALEAIGASGPFAVIVSDMRMPSMDGVQFLARAREVAPRTVRMMLTGNNDLETAIRAVRDGNVFRFLTKPCSPEILAEAIRAGLEQHQLIMAEVELLEKTLSGSVKMLTDLLSMLDVESFGRTESVRAAARAIVKGLGLAPSWEIDLAATLAPIGFVTVPPHVLTKSRAGQALTPLETQIMDRVPEVGATLLGNIPRLESVAQAVLYQGKNFDGSGPPADDVRGEKIPLGARVLKVVTDMLALEERGVSRLDALTRMSAHPGEYDPAVLAAATASFRPAAREAPSGGSTPRTPTLNIAARHLRVGHVLAANLEMNDGRLLIAAGTRLTEALLERARNFVTLGGVREPVRILPPDDIKHGPAGSTPQKPARNAPSA